MSKYCIKAENKHGKVLILRRGFESQSAAEDYPIKLSRWKRVWVEPWTKSGEATHQTRLKRHEAINLCFESILNAALAGERCPENGTRNVSTARASALAAAGRIKIEVFARNYRVATILTGPHAGKKTAPPPYNVHHPKLAITKDGKRIFRMFAKRGKS